jgi:hypothetical protein
MDISKRRRASTRAVSRKVEGIEPRNQGHRKDGACVARVGFERLPN